MLIWSKKSKICLILRDRDVSRSVVSITGDHFIVFVSSGLNWITLICIIVWSWLLWSATNIFSSSLTNISWSQAECWQMQEKCLVTMRTGWGAWEGGAGVFWDHETLARCLLCWVTAPSATLQSVHRTVTIQRVNQLKYFFHTRSM